VAGYTVAGIHRPDFQWDDECDQFLSQASPDSVKRELETTPRMRPSGRAPDENDTAEQSLQQDRQIDSVADVSPRDGESSHILDQPMGDQTRASARDDDLAFRGRRRASEGTNQETIARAECGGHAPSLKRDPGPGGSFAGSPERFQPT